MQVMLERQKDYVAKQKVGEDENDVPEKREEDQEGYDGIPLLLLPHYFSIPFYLLFLFDLSILEQC